MGVGGEGVRREGSAALTRREGRAGPGADAGWWWGRVCVTARAPATHIWEAVLSGIPDLSLIRLSR